MATTKKVLLFFAIIASLCVVPNLAFSLFRNRFMQTEFKNREKIAKELARYRWTSESTKGSISDHLVSASALPKDRLPTPPKVKNNYSDAFCTYTVFEFEESKEPGAAEYMEIGAKYFRVVGNRK